MDNADVFGVLAAASRVVLAALPGWSDSQLFLSSVQLTAKESDCV
jgi:hypothetical protein